MIAKIDPKRIEDFKRQVNLCSEKGVGLFSGGKVWVEAVPHLFRRYLTEPGMAGWGTKDWEDVVEVYEFRFAFTDKTPYSDYEEFKVYLTSEGKLRLSQARKLSTRQLYQCLLMVFACLELEEGEDELPKGVVV